jgi:hypothetical protein
MSNSRQEGVRASKFVLGRVVATPGALNLLREAHADPAILLWRHQSGDWGDVDASDRLHNDDSLERGLRVLSAYKLQLPPSPPQAGNGHATLWIITEADRSVTTLLLPEEY